MEDTRSLTGLATEAMHQAASLFRSEARLARAEIAEHVGSLGGGVALVGTSVALLIPGLTLLLLACASAVSASGMAQHWALAIFGGASVALGLVFGLVGRRRFRSSSLMPEKTLDQLRRDARAAKHQLGTEDGQKRAA